MILNAWTSEGQGETVFSSLSLHLLVSLETLPISFELFWRIRIISLSLFRLTLTLIVVWVFFNCDLVLNHHLLGQLLNPLPRHRRRRPRLLLLTLVSLVLRLYLVFCVLPKLLPFTHFLAFIDLVLSWRCSLGWRDNEASLALLCYTSPLHDYFIEQCHSLPSTYHLRLLIHIKCFFAEVFVVPKDMPCNLFQFMMLIFTLFNAFLVESCRWEIGTYRAFALLYSIFFV